MQLSPLSDKDQKEKAKQCEFVQGLLLSTFLDDNLWMRLLMLNFNKHIMLQVLNMLIPWQS